MEKKSIEEIILEALENAADSDNLRPLQNCVQPVYEMEKAEGANFDGTVKLQDGRIIVKDPVGYGKYPTLSTGVGIKVNVNGKPLKDIEIITEETQLEVMIEQDEPCSGFDILLSEDELEAHCTIKLICGKIYRLANHGECNHLVLQREEVEEVYPATINLADVKIKLLELGISYGVVLDQLEKELNNPPGGINQQALHYISPD